tara:strand:+ start:308 stop:544 length:237 start_codon:yes stop_codon:yes gene_type:complete
MPFDKKNRKTLMPEGMRNPRGRDLSTPLAPSEFDYRDVGADQLMKMQAKKKKIKRDKIAKMTADQAIKAFNSTMQTPG